MGARAPRPATTTLLFTDLVRSTELLDLLGEDRAAAVGLAHLATLRREVVRHGGREVKSTGDGLMVAFPSALSAVSCAADMQRATAREPIDGVQLGLRVGINAGEVIPQGDDLYGRAVVVASRLCGRAGAGEIITTRVVATLVGAREGHAFEDLGGLQLRGLDDPVDAVRVRWVPRDLRLAAADGEARPAGAPAIVLAAPPPRRRTAPPLPQLVTRLADGALVGRTAPLDGLLRQLDPAAPATRRLALLAGEPGIGKTRLAAELAVRAREQGATVLWGRCETEALVPFQPFVTALDHLVAAQDVQALRQDLGPRARDLARVLPSLREDDGAGGDDERRDDPDTERYRLLEAVVALLELAARDAPHVVLVLDDLHWADRESLLLLKHLLRAPRASRLLVVGTYRDVETGASHPLAATLAELRRDGLWDRERLEGLDVDGVGTMAAAATGSAVPHALAAALHEATEGHPFFVQELVRHLVENGGLGSWRGQFLIRQAIGRTGIPEGIREVVTGRLRLLDDATRGALQVAAVCGQEFALDVLAGATGQTEAGALEQLAPAVESQLVRTVPEAPGRLAFSHALVRATLYDDLGAAVRAQLHGRVGEALEQVPAERRGEGHASELAHHVLAATRAGGDLDRAVDTSVAAAEQAARGLALEKACDHFRDAVEVLGRLPGTEARRCHLLLVLGETRWQAGQYQDARHTLRRAADLAEQLGLVEDLARAALGFGGRVGFQASAPDPDVVDLLERALAALGDRPSPLRAKVRARLALGLLHLDQPERQTALADAALEEAEAYDDVTLRMEVLSYAAFAKWSPDNLDWRLQVADELVAMSARTGSMGLVIWGRYWRIAQLLEAGLVEAADADLAECERLAEEVRQPYHLWQVAIARAQQALGRGVDQVAIDRVWHAFHIGAGAENYAAMQVFSGQMLVGYGLAGRTQEFIAAARAMTEQFATMPLFRAGLAATCCQAGKVDDARAIFEELAQDDFAAIPRDWFWLWTYDLLAEVCWVLGDRRRARVLHERLAPFAERNVVLGAWGAPRGSASRPVGLLAAAAGDLDEAVERLDRAVVANRRFGVGPLTVVAQLDLARALADRDGPGDHARATAVLEEARPAIGPLGLGSLDGPADALARRLGLPVAPRPAPPAPSVLERAAVRVDAARSAVSVRGRDVLGRVLGDVTDEVLDRRFGHPLAQRALFAAMVRSFQPRLAAGFTGEIGLVLCVGGIERDDRPQHWTLRIRDGKASARHRPARDAETVVTVRVADFVRLMAGEHNPVGLWISRAALADGNILMAPRMIEMFGGVRLAEALADA